MHERQQSEPEKPHYDVAPTLAYLLGEGEEDSENFDGFYISKLLYSLTCNPDQSEPLNKLFTITYETNDKTLARLIGQTVKKEASRDDFLRGLATVAGDFSNPSLMSNTQAVRLAHSIDAWELAETIRFVRQVTAQTSVDELTEWQPLIVEVNRYFAKMDTVGGEQLESPLFTSSANEGNTARQDASLKVFRDFINSLDQDGGLTGDK